MDSISQMSGGIIYFVAIIGIFYFFIIRPQSQKQKERQKMLDMLEKGDNVITIGGVHGSVTSFKKDKSIVVVKVADKLTLDIDRTAISVIHGKLEADPNQTK